jgi:hypothetical protein
MLNLEKVAKVLDAAADHLDAIEAEKMSSARAERQERIDALAAKYADATGEEMPDSIRQKLAASDTDVVELVNSMIEKQAGAVEALGGPSSLNDDSTPTTVKEAADQAEDRFLSWINS